MSAVDQGLRARKKAKTRRDIVMATLELTIEHGYANTSLADIAERAEVSRRTVSSYFAGKDEIAFYRSDEYMTTLRATLADRRAPLVDRLVGWLSEMNDRVDREVEQLRLRASTEDPAMRTLERHWLDQVEQAIADAAAIELGQPAHAPGPRIWAAAAVGMILALRGGPTSDDATDLSPALPAGALDFLRAGLDLLRAPTATR